MEKNVEKYLPKKVQTKSVQAYIDKTLFENVDKYRKAKEVTWSELVAACFQLLLEDKNETKKTR